MAKIDLDKFVCSLMSRMQDSAYCCDLDKALADQGLEYNGGEIVSKLELTANKVVINEQEIDIDGMVEQWKREEIFYGYSDVSAYRKGLEDMYNKIKSNN